METNDPCLVELVRRPDAGEMIIDTIDFSQTPSDFDDLATEDQISALAKIICQAGDKPAAALFVLMGTLEHSADPKVLANSVKHLAFALCAELDLYGLVDAQIDVIESELLTAQ